MKSWFEPEGARAKSQVEFVPFASEADEFVPFVARTEGQGTSWAPGAASDPHDHPSLEAQLAAAFERGLGEGRAERSECDSADATRALGVLSAAASELEDWALRESKQWSSTAIDLSLMIAERIVRSRISLDREGFQSRVAAAFENLGNRRGARLFVSVADLSWLEAREESALAELREERALEIESDPALEAGEFRLAHRGAVVDGRVDAMLERFREALVDLSAESGGDA